MNKYRSINPDDLSLGARHAYLLSAVAPRPIAFASTVNKDGKVNLSPFSYFNVFSANPPVLIFSPARRGRDNTTKHTYENIKETSEVVINIVNYPIVEQMSLTSTEYEVGVNEFIKAGLTQVPSEKVTPPRVGESPVAFECKVDQVITLGKEGGAGNLILSRVVMMHIQEQYLDQHNKLDTTKLDLVARMGGNWYCRADAASLFEIPKPLSTKGIGVDQLPDSIRLSYILNGNNLGRLGNLEKLPSAEEVSQTKEDDEIQGVIEQCNNTFSSSKDALHRLAQDYLQHGKTEKAMKVLMVADGLQTN